jgi:pyrophosphatase PpaX
MTVKAVVFDLHGTIVEYRVNSKAARAEVTEYLISQGIPQTFFSPNESYFEALNKLQEHVEHNPTLHKNYQQLRESVSNILDKYETENIESTCIIPGMIKVLQTLQNRGIKLGLLTVNGQKSTDLLLSKFNLKPYFQAIITRNTAPRLKPHPSHLEALLKTLEVKPQEAVVVGDSTLDVRVAHAAGTPAIGVLGGIAKKEELVKAGADYVSKSPVDLTCLIEKLT